MGSATMRNRFFSSMIGVAAVALLAALPLVWQGASGKAFAQGAAGGTGGQAIPGGDGQAQAVGGGRGGPPRMIGGCPRDPVMFRPCALEKAKAFNPPRTPDG